MAVTQALAVPFKGDLPLRPSAWDCALPMSMQSAALSHFPLSQRDYALQPKVGLPRQRLAYLGFCAPVRNNPNGVAPKWPMMGATPSALKMLFEHCSQGRSCLPTLGLWGGIPLGFECDRFENGWAKLNSQEGNCPCGRKERFSGSCRRRGQSWAPSEEHEAFHRTATSSQPTLQFEIHCVRNELLHHASSFVVSENCQRIV